MAIKNARAGNIEQQGFYIVKIFYSELILLGKPVLQNVKALKQYGGNNIELMLDGAGWDNVDGLWDQLALDLPKTGAVFSVHPAAWDTNLTSPVKALREAALQLHKDTIRFAKKIGAAQVVLHPGFAYSPAFDKKQARIWAAEATEQLIAAAKPLGIRLAFENVGYHGASIYDFDEYCHALNGLDDTVGYLVDTGHAHINGWDVAAMIDRVQDRLYGIHLHDNGGDADQHLPIYEGNLNWPEIFESIRRIPRDCDLILEYTPGTPLERLARGRDILMEKLHLTEVILK
jgi:sugar phosphate isomerase/epimerase